MATMQKINDDYSEKCLLAMMISDSNFVDMINGRVEKEYFYTPVNKRIYEKICLLQKNRKPINLVSVAEDENIELQKRCAEISGLVAGTTGWESYLNTLYEYYVTRTARNDIKLFLENMTPENINTKIDELGTKLSKYSAKKSDGFSMTQLAYNNATEVDNASKKNALFTGFESGFENLDTVLDGWQQGTMYVIGARPSIGKTAFALSIITGLARKGTKCSAFSLEMSAGSLFYRMVSAASNIPMWQIRKGLIGTSQAQIGRYLNAGKYLSTLPISVFDSDVDNDKVLYSRIRYEARVKGSKVIMIDHLGLIEVSDSSGQRYVDVGRITKTLHKMAKELNICIIVLAQCGREAEGKKPNLALLRESGNIEQDADVIMLLHRKRELDDTTTQSAVEEVPTDVIVAKNRDGRTGTAPFSFKPLCMKFREDLSRSALDEFGERSSKPISEEKQNEIPY